MSPGVAHDQGLPHCCFHIEELDLTAPVPWTPSITANSCVEKRMVRMRREYQSWCMYSTHALLCSPGEMKSQRNPVFVLKKLLAPSATHMLCSTKTWGQQRRRVWLLGAPSQGRIRVLWNRWWKGRAWAQGCENTQGILRKKEKLVSDPVWVASCLGCGSQPWLPVRLNRRKKYRCQMSDVVLWVVAHGCVHM